MITGIARSRLAFKGRRLDAHYFLSPGVQAGEKIVMLKAAGILTRVLGGASGVGRVVPSARSKRVYAGPGEPSIPYLRPYDVFDYLPQATALLSAAASPGVASLMPERGCILQTCSGRNLGPLAYADNYLARFALSDDMLRLYIDDEQERYYCYAFLNTGTGQALLRRNKTGGVVDHLSADDLAAVEVPFVPALVERTASAIHEAVHLREYARLTLAGLLEKYEATLPAPGRRAQLCHGWSARSSDLSGRLDAAFHDPLVQDCRKALADAGGLACGDVARVFVPPRYKRYYVKPEHGRPVLSGRQLLQWRPVNLRHIAARSFEYGDYELQSGWLAFGAEGRAEDRLGFPSMITCDRARWLASEHVMRVAPKEGFDCGALWLSFAAWQSQAQIKAYSCGSVIDEVNPWDLAKVVLAPLDTKLGAMASDAWNAFARAGRAEEEAVQALETAFNAVATDLQD